ncbi:MAG: hypothetical protein RLY49_66 [Candidatus Parcubacteria bacterium]|jgi:hypothetical protein
MDKQQIISFIQRQVEEGRITQNEIYQIFNPGTNQTQTMLQVGEHKDDHTKNLINIFYGIGAIIVLIGIVILIGQNWDDIGFGGRVGVTLGVSLIAYIFGFILRNNEQKLLSPLSFVISGVLLPLGSYIICDEFSIEYSLTTQIAISAIITVLFANALLITKKNILILLTIGYASWFYIVSLIKVLDMGYTDIGWMKWAIMLLGVSYILISYALNQSTQVIDEHDRKEKRSIQKVLYAFGTLGILGAGIAVGGFFDLVFIAIVFAMFYLSTYIKSKEMLGLSSIFLMAHIIKLTSKYFADMLSWPIALIGVGFMIISIGYATYYLNREFIVKKHV